MNENGLTPQQQAFADYYLEDQDRNAKAAYLKAYPKSSDKAAESSASDLLRHPKVSLYVQERLDQMLAKVRERFEVSEERVLGLLARIAFSQVSDFFEWGPEGVKLKPSELLTEEQVVAVAEVSKTGGTVRLKLHDKLRALELLGKRLKLWSDKMEHEHLVSGELSALLKEIDGQSVDPPSVIQAREEEAKARQKDESPKPASGAAGLLSPAE